MIRKSVIVCAVGFAVLVLGGCGLEATEPAPSEQSITAAPEASPPSRTSDIHYAPEPVAIPPRPEPVRALLPTIARDGATIISTSGSATPEAVRSAHVGEVRRLECRDQHVDYPAQFDHWHRIDLDADGADEYLVFFTLEGFGGGNNYVRYLVVYRNVEPVWFPSFAAIVGGKGSAGVTGSTIRLAGSVLTTDALLPDDDDGTCCPSIESELTFDVGIGGALTPRPTVLSETGESYQYMLEFVSGCG